MKNYLQAGLLTILFLFNGCASARPGGFLTDYQSLQKGQYLEKVFISPELKAFNPASLKVEMPKVLGAEGGETFTPEEAQNYLKNVLEVNLRVEAGLSADADASETFKLETAITELEPGSRAARWFAGELGAGHSHVQVEGKLIDPSGNIVLQFQDRRAGSAVGGMDITGGDPKELMRTDLEGIAKSVAQTIAELKTRG